MKVIKNVQIVSAGKSIVNVPLQGGRKSPNNGGR